jgi:hypothetical protein
MTDVIAIPYLDLNKYLGRRGQLDTVHHRRLLGS